MKDKVVLFDGTDLDGFYVVGTNGDEPDWKIEDGVMTVGHKSIVSKYEFGDAHIHVEFYLPDMPEAEGQWKSNSGVYVHGCYEIQILDSYGNEPNSVECGGIYKMASPIVNACAPTEQWQSYDIYIRAAKLNDDGSVAQSAVITVVHNGQVIHNNLTLPTNTPGGVYDHVVERGPLMLQDHLCPVSFRNVWVQPLE